MTTKLYEHISRRLLQITVLEGMGDKHYTIAEVITRLNANIRDYMPSGSGLDNGVRLNYEESNADKLVFDTEFHHMNEQGFYDGWTNHQVFITPSLSSGFDIHVTGDDRNHVKEDISQRFETALNYIDSYFY